MLKTQFFANKPNNCNKLYKLCKEERSNIQPELCHTLVDDNQKFLVEVQLANKILVVSLKTFLKLSSCLSGLTLEMRKITLFEFWNFNQNIVILCNLLVYIFFFRQRIRQNVHKQGLFFTFLKIVFCSVLLYIYIFDHVWI